MKLFYLQLIWVLWPNNSAKNLFVYFTVYLAEQTKVYLVINVVLLKKKKDHAVSKKRFQARSHRWWKVQESENQADISLHPGSSTSLAVWPQALMSPHLVSIASYVK